MRTVGQSISLLRKNKGLSQTELAKMLHIGTSTLGMWETDKRKPNSDMIVKLADTFEVTTDYILGRKTDLGDTPVAAHISGKIDDLTPEEQQEIDDYIEFKKAQFKKRHDSKD